MNKKVVLKQKNEWQVSNLWQTKELWVESEETASLMGGRGLEEDDY